MKTLNDFLNKKDLNINEDLSSFQDALKEFNSCCAQCKSMNVGQFKDDLQKSLGNKAFVNYIVLDSMTEKEDFLGFDDSNFGHVDPAWVSIIKTMTNQKIVLLMGMSEKVNTNVFSILKDVLMNKKIGGKQYNNLMPVLAYEDEKAIDKVPDDIKKVLGNPIEI